MHGGLDLEQVLDDVFEAVCTMRLADSSGDRKMGLYHRWSHLALEPWCTERKQELSCPRPDKLTALA